MASIGDYREQENNFIAEFTDFSAIIEDELLLSVGNFILRQDDQ